MRAMCSSTTFGGAFRTTMLKTDDGREVIVPNATFMTSPVTNLTRFPLRRGAAWLIVDDGEKPIGADAIRDALAGLVGLSKEPTPAVELRSVSGGRAHYQVTFWAADPGGATSATVAALRARFPHGEVHGA